MCVLLLSYPVIFIIYKSFISIYFLHNFIYLHAHIFWNLQCRSVCIHHWLMIYKLWMFVCAAYMNDFYRDFRVDTSRHGSVPETTPRQKVNIWGLLDGQFLRARPHDQQPFWGWFTPAISGYFWFVGRFMAMHHTPWHLRLVIYQEFVHFLPVR